jgi:electron transfer flavoprotein beta subunit
LRQVRVRQEVERGYEVLECNLPALVTISKGDMVRRAPSLDSLLKARKKPITVVNANDLGLPESSLGLQGSHTQVVKVFPPATRQANRLVNGLEASGAAREIYNYLKEQNFLDKEDK